MGAALTDYRLPGDDALFAAFNHHTADVLDGLWVAASSRAFGIVTVTAMALWILWKHRRAAVPGLVQLAIAIVVTDQLGTRVLKPLFGRMRPCYALAEAAVRVLSPAANVGSMPSLHAANAFAVATVVTAWLPRAGWVAFPIAVWVALSRVGVGVHWPSDILAGALYGAAMGGAVVLTARRAGWKRPPTSSTAPSA